MVADALSRKTPVSLNAIYARHVPLLVDLRSTEVKLGLEDKEEALLANFQIDGQSEKTIQTLEDMLRSSVLQFGNGWLDCLDLMEFAYNNSYHSSIGMAPFEALYGKSCRMPLCWSEVCERVLVGPEIVDETTQNIQRGVVRFGKKDPSHVIPPQSLEINSDLTYDEEPVTILDRKDKVLRNKIVPLVKVLWRNHSVQKATWETEDRIREMYPRLFYDN
ncbi:uncharacterized protein LOC126608298 [Malus sylvestris]|uniref:uncharacterized protein LOC126608298 n=1 Tax=Malus sylvestris TaxID=3752 RepID=UPI0021AC3CE9|nr:uncharacterized protein LOC126608298 [Malus sylvestris]